MSDRTLVILTTFSLEQMQGAPMHRMQAYSKALLSKSIKTIMTSVFFGLDSLVDAGDGMSLAAPRIHKVPGRWYSIILQQLDFLRQLRYCRRVFSKFFSGSENDVALLVYPTSFASTIVPLAYFKWLRGKKVFFEKNELDVAIYKNRQKPNGLAGSIMHFVTNPLNIAFGYFADSLPKRSSGVICISHAIRDYYKLNKDSIRVPILSSRVGSGLNKASRDNETFRLCFTGAIADKKDHILVLVDALGDLKKNGKEFFFDIYGPASKQAEATLRQTISRNNVENEVVYHGPVPGSRIPEIQENSDLLLKIRPRNMQNVYGFSTKLAEYLNSGTPVLTTDVGDNSKYLKDQETAYLLDSQNITRESLVRRIDEILSLPKERSQAIGKAGRDLALKNFVPEVYSDSLESLFFK